MLPDTKNQDEAMRLLRQSSMFHACSEQALRKIAKDMDLLKFGKGDTLLEQGAPQSKAFFISDGQIRRERVVNDQSHQVVDMFGNTDPDKFGNRKIAIGALHVLHAEPAFANAKAMSDGHAYTLSSASLKKHLIDPTVSTVT
ncbi:hypothetical protein T484DRAFT_2554498 [Baffinella frigidus]|nr:hypothetical protein T484DRAFT_2554498 [Cryptophyta sp. CCMP2293]